MKNRYLPFTFVFVLFFIFESKSQQEIDVKNWIEKNQNVVLINSEYLNEFSNEDLSLLKNQYIIFNKYLNSGDIINYEKNIKSKEEKITSNDLLTNKSDEDTENKIFIDNWLKNHKELKILKKSEYKDLPDNVIQEYNLYKCLLLKGEIITKLDILNYPY